MDARPPLQNPIALPVKMRKLTFRVADNCKDRVIQTPGCGVIYCPETYDQCFRGRRQKSARKTENLLAGKYLAQSGFARAQK